MATIQAWQYSAASEGLEKSIKLTDIPKRDPSTLKKDEILVEVIAASLNPADYKVAEMPVAGKLVIGTPAVPGMDFSGKVHAAHESVTSIKTDQLVFGRLNKFGRGDTKLGTLSQFIVVTANDITAIPEGIDPVDAAGIGTVGLTAYEGIAPYLKSGQKVLLIGASGGLGTMAIQIAKAMDIHVTAVCSTEKASLCNELGADDIIDYKKGDVLEALKAKGPIFDHVVDNVGNSAALYKHADLFTKPTAKYILFGGGNAKALLEFQAAAHLPKALGGGPRTLHFKFTEQKGEDLQALSKLLADGKLKVIVEEVFPWKSAPEAITKLKQGSSKGKIIVRVKE